MSESPGQPLLSIKIIRKAPKNPEQKINKNGGKTRKKRVQLMCEPVSESPGQPLYIALLSIRIIRKAPKNPEKLTKTGKNWKNLEKITKTRKNWEKSTIDV